jgi:zinc protease
MEKMKKKRHVLPLLGILLACSTTGLAQPLPLDTAVRTGKLSNGFTYYIRYNNEPQDRVIFYLANKIGSMQEDDDQRGLAHFMEHMSFNGTKHYPKNQLVEYLQKSGVRFGADLNAYTGFNETVYQLPLPSDDTALVRNGLQIMRDWAAEALLETSEIDKERGVVLEEKRLRNGASQRFQERSFPLQVNNSRYANRLPIGTDQVLNNFTPGAVKRFYKDWYRPNQQALIVVGDIDVKAMESQIKKLFGDLKNPVNERAVARYHIPLTGKNQFLAATDAEQTATQISVLIKQPEQFLKTKADFRAHIVRSLLNQAIGGRLGELAERPEPPFIQAQAGMGGFMGGLDAFAVSIVPKPGRIKDAFNMVWTEIVRLQQHGITQTEFERGKHAYLSGLENIYKEKSKIASSAYVQEYLAYYLQGVAAPGIEMEYAMAKAHISTISIEEVNALARRVVKDVDRDIMVFAPEKEKADLPTEAQWNAWINTVKQQKLTAWKDATSDKQLLSKLPAAGKVVDWERMDSIGVTIYTLSNGVKVWVKPTSFKNEEILFAAFSQGGTSLYPDSLFLQASAAPALIPANGLDVFGPVELGKMLNGKAVQVQPFVQDMYEGVNGAANTKDLETALQLTHLYFTKPRYDTTLFSNNIKANRAIMPNRANSPESAFGDTVGLVTGGYHYRRQPPSVAKLDSISLDKAFAIYKERFANAADFVFVFTGSIDTATFLPLVERYLGSLPATNQREVYKDLGIYIPKGRISKTVYKGKDNKAVVKLYYSGDYTFNTANNTQLVALGSVLHYRITERIRELEGGAYTPRAGVDYGKLPRSKYLVSIEFTCAPQSVEKLIDAANDEINKMKAAGGISEDDINKFKAEQMRSRETQLQTNAFWQSWLTYVLQNNVPSTGVFYLKERLSLVTPQSVQQAVQQFINDENYIRLVLMPEP